MTVTALLFRDDAYLRSCTARVTAADTAGIRLDRIMSVKLPSGQGPGRLLDIAGIDLQPCGGAHLRRTGEIGRVEVGRIENKGKQNRRVIIAFAD